MPRRTNEFQQLVLLIQNQLADDAIVRESHMLADNLTGSDVEVDVTVETQVNQIPILIGIECTAERRPISVEWVREMLGKHQTLPIDKTVLVSKSGFSAEARARAEAENILSIGLDEAKDFDWSAYVGSLSNLRLGSFNFSVTGGKVHFAEPVESSRAVLDGQTPIRVPAKQTESTLQQYALMFLGRPDVGQALIRKWLGTPATQRTESSEFTLTVTPSELTQIQSVDGEWLPLRSIDIQVSAQMITSALEVKQAGFGGYELAFGVAPNIFKDEERAADYVLVNLLGQGGTPLKASILFPGTATREAEIHHMQTPNAPTKAKDG